MRRPGRRRSPTSSARRASSAAATPARSASTAQGFVAAAFRHRTSRAQDPHLHTHVIVANMARAADGEWRALDGEAILKDLPARRRLPLRGAAAPRGHPAARPPLDRAGEGHGRPRGRTGGSSAGVLDEAAVARRAHAGARHGRLHRRPRRRARHPRGERTGRPAAAARAVAGARGRARPRPARARDLVDLQPRAFERYSIAGRSRPPARPGSACRETDDLHDARARLRRRRLAAGRRHGRAGARDGRGARRASPASSFSAPSSARGGRRASRRASCSRSSARRSSLLSPAAARMRRAWTRRSSVERSGRPADRRAAGARPRGLPATRPGRLRRRRRRRRKDHRPPRAQRGLPDDRAPGDRSGAERPRRRRARRRHRHPNHHPPPPSPRRRQRRWPPTSLHPRRRRGRHGRHAHPRAAASHGRPGAREGDPRR